MLLNTPVTLAAFALWSPLPERLGPIQASQGFQMFHPTAGWDLVWRESTGNSLRGHRVHSQRVPLLQTRDGSYGLQRREIVA